jgi:glycosyltransferase involved in cell wall biosynthesis
MRITLLSPYHGGSHAAWADGYRAASQHQVDILALPARFWKWRMHGGALTLARQFVERGERPEMILATDMLDLTTFLALTRQRTAGLPVALYMHENQLTYPLPADPASGPMRRQKGERDLHYAFVNLASMLAADRVYFNSAYHQDSLLAALPPFLRHFPEYNELESVATIAERSELLPVGVDLSRLDAARAPAQTEPPLILWSQRWEYDKRPERFLAALAVMAGEGRPFQVALCGPRAGERPGGLERAIAALGERVIYDGFAPPAEHAAWLWRATITISTAEHEFFGVSLVEALYAHTFPILPAALSYPELIPVEWHGRCLYQSWPGLLERLRWALSQPAEALACARMLATAAATYDWSRVAPAYDARFVANLKNSPDR